MNEQKVRQILTELDIDLHHFISSGFDDEELKSFVEEVEHYLESVLNEL